LSLTRRKIAVVSAAAACAAGGALGGTLTSTPSALSQHTYASRLASASSDTPIPNGPLPGRGAYWMVPGTQFPALPHRGYVVGTATVSGPSSTALPHASVGVGSVPVVGGGVGGTGGGLVGSAGKHATQSCVALPAKDAKDIAAALKRLGLSKEVSAGKLSVKVSSSGVKVCGASLPKNLKSKLLHVLSILLPPVTVPTVTIPPVTLPGSSGGGGL